MVQINSPEEENGAQTDGHLIYSKNAIALDGQRMVQNLERFWKNCTPVRRNEFVPDIKTYSKTNSTQTEDQNIKDKIIQIFPRIHSRICSQPWDQPRFLKQENTNHKGRA